MLLPTERNVLIQGTVEKTSSQVTQFARASLHINKLLQITENNNCDRKITGLKNITLFNLDLPIGAVYMLH